MVYFTFTSFMNISCFLSADPSMGKIDKHLLSEQTVMELLIENITKNKNTIYRKNLEDISQWKGLIFDDSNAITEIYWNAQDLVGEMPLQWLPLDVLDVLLDCNALHGTVNLTCLPERLYSLSLSHNRFDGTVDLTKLPQSLYGLYLDDNRFCGNTDFSQLPESLVDLDVEDTQLEGEILVFHGNLWDERSLVKDMRLITV